MEIFPDPRTEAQMLLADPDHLRRKAAYILEQAKLGGPLETKRRDRAAELLQEADRLSRVR